MNRIPVQRLNDRIVGNMNMMLDQHFTLNAGPALNHHFIVDQNRPAAQPGFATNQDVMFDDAVALDQRVFGDL
ncbi:hypothetical protein D3C75_1376910 [compost metagenome]